VQRARVELLGRVLQLGPGPGVGQIGHRHIGQDLCYLHVARAEWSRSVAVEVQRAERLVVLAEGKGEDGAQTGRGGPRPEHWEGIVPAQVGQGDRSPGLVSGQAWPLADFCLQRLEAQCGGVGGGDVVGALGPRDEGHPRPGNGKDVDDPPHQMVENPLNREVGGHGGCELAQHICQLPIGCHSGHTPEPHGLLVGVPSSPWWKVIPCVWANV
jgi:hypothetical protein